MAYANVIDYKSHPRMVAVRDAESGKIAETNRQTGFWERLLCKTCEMKFSRYETYAADHLLNAKLTPSTDSAHALNFLKNRRLCTAEIVFLVDPMAGWRGHR